MKCLTLACKACVLKKKAKIGKLEILLLTKLHCLFARFLSSLCLCVSVVKVDEDSVEMCSMFWPAQCSLSLVDTTLCPLVLSRDDLDTRDENTEQPGVGRVVHHSVPLSPLLTWSQTISSGDHETDHLILIRVRDGSTELDHDHLWTAQIPGSLLQVRYHSHIRWAAVVSGRGHDTVAGLDLGDRQALEHKYSGCDPPCLLDSSDGRWTQSTDFKYKIEPIFLRSNYIRLELIAIVS